MWRWLSLAGLGLGAIVCAGIGLTHQPTNGPSRPSTAGGATPILSARRLPAALGGLVADERLASRLQATLADPSMTGTDLCLEASLDGSPVFARASDNPLIPASNLKLLTAYAALDKLGPATTFNTSVVAPVAPANGVVTGPLYLVGGGDPLLATAGYRAAQTDWTESKEPVTSIEQLADRVKASGITRVTGGIVGDDSRYDHERSLPTWKASYLSTGEIGPVGALVVNDGFLDQGIHRVPSADPAAAAASTLTALLRARGVVVDGSASSGPVPAGGVNLASMASLPVSDIVGEMLRESDNLAAEMLTKELGARFGGGGTWAAGTVVIREALTSAGLPLDGLVQVDGSGLDRGDRVSCRTLGALTAAHGPLNDMLAASLPTAGNCGTLVKRFTQGPPAGRIRAKTGSLTGVAALTGYVSPSAVTPPPPCPPGAPGTARAETFALLVNGVTSDAAGMAIEDRVANALASYPETPVLDPLSPL